MIKLAFALSGSISEVTALCDVVEEVEESYGSGEVFIFLFISMKRCSNVVLNQGGLKEFWI